AEAKVVGMHILVRASALPGSGTGSARRAVPRAPAQNPKSLLAALFPGATIRWGLEVAVVPDIGAPFQRVAMHIIEPERVCLSQGANRQRLLAAFAREAQPLVRLLAVVIHILGRYVVAEGKGRG